MIIKKYPAPPIETAAERYDRDWLNIPDLDTAGKDDYRHARTLLEQTVERKSRRYVDDGISAVTGGAPIFGEDGVIITPPIEPDSLWTENFTGPLGPEWSLEGTYDPPGGQPTGNEGETLFQVSRAFAPNKFKIDLELDFPNQSGSEDNHFFTQLILQSPANENMVGIFAHLDIETNKGALIFYAGIHRDPVEFTGNKISLVNDGDNYIVFVNEVEVLRQEDNVNLGDDTVLTILLQTNMGGSIKSISAYDLGSNGGGTPEPEEPEVPEGSYQEIYTENY